MKGKRPSYQLLLEFAAFDGSLDGCPVCSAMYDDRHEKHCVYFPVQQYVNDNYSELRNRVEERGK